MSELNIYQRINAVMQEVQYVQKDKQISGGGANYKAVTHDQVISVARAALVKHGVVIFPNQLEGGFLQMRDVNATPTPIKMGLYSGKYEISFVGIDKGDKITATVEAHANDNGDKAPGKALTYATKAAILKVLCLETGEDEESRADMANTDVITDAQAGTLYGLLVTDQGVLSEKGQKLAKAFKFGIISDIPSKKYDAILKKAQQ